MQIIGLLIIVIIFVIFAKPKNAKYYRIAVGSIFGIAYFCLWLFIRYYAQIYEWGDAYVSTSLIALGVFSALLCSLPFITRINQVGSLILLAVFLVNIFITFAFEHEIKFAIAEVTGYFDANNPLANSGENFKDSRLFEYKQGGYSVELPKAWSQHQHTSSEFPYFQLVKKENNLAEFRLKCLHKLKLALPEIVLNITTQNYSNAQVKHEKDCFQWQKSYSACMVRSSGLGEGGAESRWRWFAVNPMLQHGIELDFVIYDSSPYVLKDVQAIISTLKVTSLPEPRSACLTPADWL